MNGIPMIIMATIIILHNLRIVASYFLNRYKQSAFELILIIGKNLRLRKNNNEKRPIAKYIRLLNNNDFEFYTIIAMFVTF